MDSCQAPLFMEFSRQEYWSGLPCPSPGDLPTPGNESVPPTLQVDSLLAEPSGKPKEGGGKIRQEWNSGVCVCVCVCVYLLLPSWSLSRNLHVFLPLYLLTASRRRSSGPGLSQALWFWLRSLRRPAVSLGSS